MEDLHRRTLFKQFPDGNAAGQPETVGPNTLVGSRNRHPFVSVRLSAGIRNVSAAFSLCCALAGLGASADTASGGEVTQIGFPSQGLIHRIVQFWFNRIHSVVARRGPSKGSV